jgi:hypothetical protein
MVLFTRTSERLKRISSRSAGFSGMATDQVSGASLNHVQPQRGSRDLRAQAVHRLQVGMFGLAGMLLLVSLASVIMQRVQTADRSVVATEPSGGASASPADDPLVDLGVAPKVPVAGNPGPRAKSGKPDSAH